MQYNFLSTNVCATTPMPGGAEKGGGAGRAPPLVSKWSGAPPMHTLKCTYMNRNIYI